MGVVSARGAHGCSPDLTPLFLLLIFTVRPQVVKTCSSFVISSSKVKIGLRLACMVLQFQGFVDRHCSGCKDMGEDAPHRVGLVFFFFYFIYFFFFFFFFPRNFVGAKDGRTPSEAHGGLDHQHRPVPRHHGKLS